MSSRIKSTQVAPGAYRVMLSLAKYVHECGIVVYVWRETAGAGRRKAGWARPHLQGSAEKSIAIART